MITTQDTKVRAGHGPIRSQLPKVSTISTPAAVCTRVLYLFAVLCLTLSTSKILFELTDLQQVFLVDEAAELTEERDVFCYVVARRSKLWIVLHKAHHIVDGLELVVDSVLDLVVASKVFWWVFWGGLP